MRHSVDRIRSTRPWIEGLETRRHFAADLSAAVSFVAPASHQVKPGQKGTLAIVVTNNGDAIAKGSLLIQLGVSASADGSSLISEGQLSKSIRLAPGKHATFRLSSKVPIGFTPGTYFAVAQIDPNNVFGDSNLINNKAVSASTLTILPPFPNLLGTWSGPIIVKKGFGKGSRGIQTDTFTSQSQVNGTFTAVGTNFINGLTFNLTGAGTITTKGVFQNSGVEVPLDASGTFTGKGRLIGNKLVITYRNAINSGTITLTRISL